MNKQQAVKKYNLVLQKGNPDPRNINHYSRDKSQYDNLLFYLHLTKFESIDGKFELHTYHSSVDCFDNVKKQYEELKSDWDRPGKRTWNSLCLIGLDETGDNFLVILDD